MSEYWACIPTPMRKAWSFRTSSMSVLSLVHRSPCSQSCKTGKVTQTCRFRTNKNALTVYRYEILTEWLHNFNVSSKNHLHIFWLNFLGSVFFFLHACLRNFPEIRETENTGSGDASSTPNIWRVLWVLSWANVLFWALGIITCQHLTLLAGPASLHLRTGSIDHTA